MKRIKITEVLMTIPVAAEGDDWDLEIQDEVFEMMQLAAGCMAKVSDECGSAKVAADQAEERYESMTLDEFRRPPVRTRPRGYRQ